MTCKAIRQNDEMFCAACGLRWDADDMFPPECRTGRVVIGLAGAARSGKSTLADHLVAKYGFTRIDVTEPLKQMLWALMRVRGCSDPDEWIYGNLKETSCPYLEGQTPRFAMQTLGTEWGRNLIGDSLWVHTAHDRIAATPGNVVIENIRFANEAGLCDKVIQIVGRGGLPDSHASEHGVQSWDVQYTNDGTIREMHAWFDYVSGLLGVALRK